MSMLAERKRKEKWSLNPRGNSWGSDKNKFGQKLLEKMGWSEGQGLGANNQGTTGIIQVKKKNDIKGLGFKDKGEEWLKTTSEFNELLDQLGSSQEENSDSTTDLTSSLEDRSKKSKARVHYHKFTRGKDLSRYTEKDLASIVGPEVIKSKTTAEIDPMYASNQVNKGSSEEYFTNKKLAKEGKTEEIQEQNDDQEANHSYDPPKKKKKNKKEKCQEDVPIETEDLNSGFEENHDVVSSENTKLDFPSNEKTNKKRSKLKESELKTEDTGVEELGLEPSNTSTKKKKKKNTHEEEDTVQNDSNLNILEQETIEGETVQQEILSKKEKKRKNKKSCVSEENSNSALVSKEESNGNGNDFDGVNAESCVNHLSNEISSDDLGLSKKKSKKRKRDSKDDPCTNLNESLKTVDDSVEHSLESEKKKKKKHQVENEVIEDDLNDSSAISPKKKKKRNYEEVQTSFEENQTLIPTTDKRSKKEKQKRTGVDVGEDEENNQVSGSKPTNKLLEVLGRKTRLRNINNPNKGLPQTSYETSEFLSLNSENHSKPKISNSEYDNNTSNQTNEWKSSDNEPVKIYYHVNKTDSDLPKQVIAEEYRILSRKFKEFNMKLPEVKVIIADGSKLPEATRKKLKLLNKSRHMKTLIPPSQLEEVEACVKALMEEIQPRVEMFKVLSEIEENTSQLALQIAPTEKSSKPKKVEATKPGIEKLEILKQMSKQLKSLVVNNKDQSTPQIKASNDVESETKEKKPDEKENLKQFQIRLEERIQFLSKQMKKMTKILSPTESSEVPHDQKENNSYEDKPQMFSHGFNPRGRASFNNFGRSNYNNVGRGNYGRGARGSSRVQPSWKNEQEASEDQYENNIEKGATYNYGRGNYNNSGRGSYNNSARGSYNNFGRGARGSSRAQTSWNNEQEAYEDQYENNIEKGATKSYGRGNGNSGRGSYNNFGRGARGSSTAQTSWKNEQEASEDQYENSFEKGATKNYGRGSYSNSGRGSYDNTGRGSYDNSSRGSYNNFGRGARGSSRAQTSRKNEQEASEDQSTSHNQHRSATTKGWGFLSNYALPDNAKLHGSYRGNFRGRGRGVRDRGAPTRHRGRISQNNHDAKMYAEKCKAENKIPEIAFKGVDLKQISGYADVQS